MREDAGIPRDTPWNKLNQDQRDWVVNGSPNWNGKWNQHWFGVKRFFEYLETKAYKMHIRVLLSKYRSYTPCPTCAGARLKTESLLWRIGSTADADAVMDPALRFLPQGVNWTRAQLEAMPGLCLHDLMLLPIERLRRFFDRISQQTAVSGSVPTSVGDHKALALLFEEITTRLRYLVDVGIGYLSLDRQSRTLSGGEVQRINLTTALGTSLVNTLFVLDEPSIGLHPRDMHRIIEAMQRLRDAGNTLVVVEHDPAVMLAADRMIDMGPGPGERGGQIVFDGSTQDLRGADTLTGAYLGGRKQVGMGFQRLVNAATPRLLLEGVCEHNLKNVSVEIPLQRLVCVTGVSGSGKSTLVQDVLAPALMRHFGRSTEAPGRHDRLLGAEMLADVVFVDQSPIGKTARSNPVSYVGAWDALRELFANAPLSRQRGYTASKFSFNSGDGRCATCGGSGFEHVEMQFLSDVYLRCPDCDGKRYRPEVLEVRIERKQPAVGASLPAPLGSAQSSVASGAPEGPRLMTNPTLVRRVDPVASRFVSMNVADVLNLTVSEAAQLFAEDRDVIRALQPIVDVGLEYVKLGQPVPTLSGGEAQRLKLAGYLAQAARDGSSSRQPVARHGSLFMFDEPTTGLHFDDIAKLMRALRKLLDAGHSLLVIEHNLDVIRASDWLLDLGPEGGDAGGELVAVGTPDDLRRHPTSHTGRALREYDASVGLGAHAAQEARALPAPRPAVPGTGSDNAIRIVNAKEHNLKVAVGGDTARQVQCDHRRQRFRQVDTGFRHPVQRRPATLSGVAQRLCAQHRAAGGSARGGRGIWHSADGGDRAAAVAWRAQVDGRNGYRGLAFPAPALRQAGRAALHTRRRSRRTADAGQHCGAVDEEFSRSACGAAGAAGGQPQGGLYRAGRLGAAAWLHPSARGRQFPADNQLPAHRPVQGTHHRTAGGQPGHRA